MCEYKDISYNAGFNYFENSSKRLTLGFDFNLKQTWVKSASCHRYSLKDPESRSICSFLDTKQNTENKKTHSESTNPPSNNEAIVDYGLIFGDYLSEKTVHINIRNSNKFASILNILKAGLFLAD